MFFLFSLRLPGTAIFGPPCYSASVPLYLHLLYTLRIYTKFLVKPLIKVEIKHAASFSLLRGDITADLSGGKLDGPTPIS